MTWHPHERAALADALTEAGPGAPTLCAGWRTEHLAAHVVLREHDPLTAAGVGPGPLAARAERTIQGLGDRSATPEAFAALVARVRAGVPRWHPLELLGDTAQLVEFFVHTEDARRGAPDAGPRPLPAGLADALWHGLVRMGRLLYRGSSPSVVLAADGGRRHVVQRSGLGEVTVHGPVGELVLHAYDRGWAARVEVSGDPAAVAALDAVRRRS